MNKLDIAIRLLRLLNERKELDSRTVARELQVSIRTAQRYLIELSTMPCVTNGSNNNTYALNEDYHLSKALLGEASSPDENSAVISPPLTIDKTTCQVCRKSGNIFDCTIFGCDEMPISNKHKIDRLTALIERRLKSRRGSYP
jgi:hypothetical protein